MNFKILLKTRVLFFVLIIISLYLRLINITSEQLWNDEAISIYYANFSFENFWDVIIKDIHPPLYYIILRNWIFLFGDSVLSCRLLSVIFSILTQPVLYLLGKSIKDEKFGIILCFFYSISPFSIYYANEVRSYSLLLLIFTISLYLSIKCVKNPNDFKFYCYLGISGVFLIYIHYIGIIYYGILCFGLIIINFKKNKQFKYISISLLITISCYIPWILYAIEDLLGGAHGYAGGRLNIVYLIYWGFYLFIAPVPSDISNLYVFNLIILTFLIYIPLTLISIFSFLNFLIYNKRLKTIFSKSILNFLIFIIGFIFGIPLILGFLVPNTFTGKNLIGGLILMYIIFGIGLYYLLFNKNDITKNIENMNRKLNFHKLKSVILAILILISVMSLTIIPIFKTSYLQKPDWNGCIKKLKSEYKSSDIILISYEGSIPPIMEYYSNINNFDLINKTYDLNYNDEGIEELFDYFLEKNLTRIWIVNFWLHIRDPNHLTENLSILHYNLTIIASYNFRLNISLVLFGFF